MSSLSTLFSSSVVSSVKSGDLSPAKGANLQDQAKKFLSKYNNLPQKTTQRQVITAAKMAGTLEAQNALLKDLAKQRLNVINNGINALQTQANYHIGVKRAETRYAQIMANTGKQISVNNLTHAQIAGNYSGFSSQFDSGMAQAEQMIEI